MLSKLDVRRKSTVTLALSYDSRNSGVTMGWLLRLVTGGPTGGRAPRQF